MKLYSLAALTAMLAVLVVPAEAHHSFNTFFDVSRTVQIEGIIKTFRLVSPHSEMTVDVTDAAGKLATWRITARTGATNAKREGWKVEEFIGKRLFTRQHQAMKLTDDGTAFYTAVGPKFDELAAAELAKGLSFREAMAKFRRI